MTPKEIGRRFRYIVHARKIQQQQIAHISGISVSHVNSVIHGRVFPSTDIIQTMCNVLDVPMSIIFLPTMMKECKDEQDMIILKRLEEKYFTNLKPFSNEHLQRLGKTDPAEFGRIRRRKAPRKDSNTGVLHSWHNP